MSNILIVEDTLTQALMIEHMLKGAGFKCTVARSGRKALELLDTEADYDAILSDINMPEMDGMELCAAVKQSNRNRIPFVLLVSLLDPGEILKIVESGADDILLKEYDESYFVPHLKTIIEISRTRQAANDSKRVLYPGGTCQPLPDTSSHILADMLLSAYGMAVHQKSAGAQESAKAHV